MVTVQSRLDLDADRLFAQLLAEADFLVGSPVGDSVFDLDDGLESARYGEPFASASPRASPAGPACCAG